MPFEKNRKMEPSEVTGTENEDVVIEKIPNAELDTVESQQLASRVAREDQQQLNDVKKRIATMPAEHGQQDAEKHDQDIYENLTSRSYKPLTLKRAAKIIRAEMAGVGTTLVDMIPTGGRMRDTSVNHDNIAGKKALEYTGTINGEEFSIKISPKSEMDRSSLEKYMPDTADSTLQVTLNGKKLSPQDSLEFYIKFKKRPYSIKEWKRTHGTWED